MKKLQKSLVAMLVAACASMATAGGVQATGVTAEQRYPWNGLVDVAVTFSGAAPDVAAAECRLVATNVATAAAIPVLHLTRNGDDRGSDGQWTRKYVWDAAADAGEVQIGDVELTVAVMLPLGGVQLWENGPYWAECNLGAESPETCGRYFWWGDAVGYERVGESWNAADGSVTGFSFSSANCPTYQKEIYQLREEGYLDSADRLAAGHDAASVELGVPWRLPTREELDALVGNCDTEWTTREGMVGRLVTGRGKFASASIFLPAAGRGFNADLNNFGSRGYYGSSLPSADDSGDAWGLQFDEQGFELNETNRHRGRTVRPVRGAADAAATLTAHLALDCRTGTRSAAETELIRFSPEWASDDAAAVATVWLDGEALTNAAEAGVLEWIPPYDGCTLTHRVTVGGKAVGEPLTATFAVEGAGPARPVISPASGTTFETSLTVNVSCPSAGATIRYTTDGTVPTAESPVYERFKVYARTTVMAVAFDASGRASAVARAEYAKGRLAAPVISPADGTVFGTAEQEVTVTREGTDGVLRYTLDGSEPTAESAVYSGPFVIRGTTTVKAKVFGHEFLDSATATAVLTSERLTVATPAIDAPAEFSGAKATVSVSCATAAAEIRYTTDGSEPTAQSLPYVGPFAVTSSCTIRARGFLEGYADSGVAVATVKRNWSLAAALNDPGRAFATEAEAPWTPDETVAHDGAASARSGALADSDGYGTYRVSRLSTVVWGQGTASFRWKASCENDVEWDHGEFSADGRTWLICGETDWQEVTCRFETAGEHLLTWTYAKDDFGAKGDDCIWVDEFRWAADCTETTDVPVPFGWLAHYYPGTTDYEARAKQLAANGVNTVEEAYVAGLEPTNATSVFSAAIAVSNGWACVSWTPDLNAEAMTRVYRVQGRTSLEKGEWATPASKEHRFFRVTVAMPTGAADEESAVAGAGIGAQAE